MKKIFLSLLFVLCLVTTPFSLMGCNDNNSNNNSTTQVLKTIEEYHSQVENISEYCGISMTDISASATTANLTLNKNTFMPNLRFIGPISNYGNLEIIFYDNLSKVELENKVWTVPSQENEYIDYQYCVFGTGDKLTDEMYYYTTNQSWVKEMLQKSNNQSFIAVLSIINNLINPIYYSKIENSNVGNVIAKYTFKEELRDKFNNTLSFVFGPDNQIGNLTLTIYDNNQLKLFIENGNKVDEFLIEVGSQQLSLPNEALR